MEYPTPLHPPSLSMILSSQQQDLRRSSPCLPCPVYSHLGDHKTFKYHVMPPVKDAKPLSNKMKSLILETIGKSIRLCKADLKFATFVKQFPTKMLEVPYQGKKYTVAFRQVPPTSSLRKFSPNHIPKVQLKPSLIFSFKNSKSRRNTLLLFSSHTSERQNDWAQIGLFKGADVLDLIQTMSQSTIAKYFQRYGCLPTQIIISINCKYAGVEERLVSYIQSLYLSNHQPRIQIVLDYDENYLDQCQQNNMLLTVQPTQQQNIYKFYQLSSSIGMQESTINDQLTRFFNREYQYMQYTYRKLSNKFFEPRPANLSYTFQGFQDYEQEIQMDLLDVLNEQIWVGQLPSMSLHQGEDQNIIESNVQVRS